MRAAEQEDALAREREKANEMKRALDAQIEEKRRRRQRERALERQREQDEANRIERERREIEERERNARRDMGGDLSSMNDGLAQEHHSSPPERETEPEIHYQPASKPRPNDLFAPAEPIRSRGDIEHSAHTSAYSDDHSPTDHSSSRYQVVKSAQRAPPSRRDRRFGGTEDGAVASESSRDVRDLRKQMDLQSKLIESLQDQIQMQASMSKSNMARIENMRQDQQQTQRRAEMMRTETSFQPISDPFEGGRRPEMDRAAFDPYWSSVKQNANQTYDELDAFVKSIGGTYFDMGVGGSSEFQGIAQNNRPASPVNVSGVPII